MKEFINNNHSTNAPILAHHLMEALDATCDESTGIHTLELGSKYGTGEIKLVNFNNGMSIALFDILLFKDLTFDFIEEDTEYLYFLYGLEGICYHDFKEKEKFTRIEELKSYIIGSDKNNLRSEISIKKDTKFICSIISVDREVYLDKFIKNCNVPQKNIGKLTKAFETLSGYIYSCSHNLQIAKQLRQLRNNSSPFDVTYLFQLEGYTQIIFSLHVEQFYKEIYEDRVDTGLTRTELQKIRLVTDYIVDNPMIDHRIKKLCYRATISPVKLQDGFKCLHGTTVSNFIRNVRIEKARDLIMNSDYNISEIAYMVGFTSRSYFCKIFKENFGYNATAYRDKFKDKAIDIKSL